MARQLVHGGAAASALGVAGCSLGCWCGVRLALTGPLTHLACPPAAAAPACSLTIRSVCIKGVHPAASDRVLIAHFGACGYIQRITHLRCEPDCCPRCRKRGERRRERSVGSAAVPARAPAGPCTDTPHLLLALRPQGPRQRAPLRRGLHAVLNGGRGAGGAGAGRWAAAAAVAAAAAAAAASSCSLLLQQWHLRSSRAPAFKLSVLAAAPAPRLTPAFACRRVPSPRAAAAGSALLQRTVRVVPSDSPAARVAASRVLRAAQPPPGLLPIPMFAGG